MANEKHKIDAQFREKFINYQEKPSALAWEKLENKLSKSEQKNGFPFWKMAASLLLLMGISYFIWLAVNSTNPTKPELAVDEQASLQDSEIFPTEVTKPLIQKDFPNTNEIAATGQEDSKNIQNQNLSPQKKSIAYRIDDQQLNLDSEISKSEENLALKEPLNPELRIPQLHIEKEAVKGILAKIEEPLENENSYRIKIISSGFLTEAEKPKLIEEIETKIEKIGGLLNKVDQGFADLQDAKNNLFVAISNKKE